MAMTRPRPRPQPQPQRRQRSTTTTSASLPAPPAAPPPKPKLSALSDTWTSSSSGHQTADRRRPAGGAAGWRQLRESQLNRQLGGRAAAPPTPRKPTDAPTTSSSGIFAGLVVHVNGGTLPLVSDHRLRALLVEHGAAVATQLRRRLTTHVVVGAPSRGGGAGAGSGGGLAAGKLHREIAGRGRAVKYVGADWVLESIRLGRRLPEAPYSRLKLAPAGQQSLCYMFQKT